MARFREGAYAGADGQLVAEFEYDPYGNVLRMEGAFDKLPFRYQKKRDMNFRSEQTTAGSFHYL